MMTEINNFQSGVKTSIELNTLVTKYRETFACEIPQMFDTEEMDSDQIEKFKALIDLSLYYGVDLVNQMVFLKSADFNAFDDFADFDDDLFGFDDDVDFNDKLDDDSDGDLVFDDFEDDLELDF